MTESISSFLVLVRFVKQILRISYSSQVLFLCSFLRGMLDMRILIISVCLLALQPVMEALDVWLIYFLEPVRDFVEWMGTGTKHGLSGGLTQILLHGLLACLTKNLTASIQV